MSDAGFRARDPHGRTAPAQDDVAEHHVPRASNLFGDRMSAVRAERASAAAQIQNSLRVWRKARGEEASPAQIPQSGGKPLPTDVRQRMEPKLGADLGGVRMHEGGESAQAASKLGARAFTVGNDVHFNAGEFNPGSKEGDRLIAHELTHVVQGQKAGVQRKAEEGEAHAGHEVSEPHEPAEKEADAKGDAVADELHDHKEHEPSAREHGKGDAKDAGKHAKDAANDEDAAKKKPGGADSDAVKEQAPATAGKLFRKIFLKPKVTRGGADERKKADEIKKYVAAKAASGKAKWSSASAVMVTTMTALAVLIGHKAEIEQVKELAPLLMGLITLIVNKYGLMKQRHDKIHAEAEIFENVDALLSAPEKLNALYAEIKQMKPELDQLKEKVEELAGQLTAAQKRDAKVRAKSGSGKRAQKRAPHASQKSETAHQVGEGAEKTEVAGEVLDKVAPAIAESAKAVAHGAQAVAPLAAGVVAAFDIGDAVKQSQAYKETQLARGGS